jgi:hypothetical protein
VLRVRLLFSSRVDGVPRARYTKNFLLLVCARALFLVPREPVRALARLAAVPRAVDARDAQPEHGPIGPDRVDGVPRGEVD